VRTEEKLIFQALRERGVAFDRIDTRKLVLDLNLDGHGADKPMQSRGQFDNYGIVLVRCLSNSRALCASRVLQMQGVRTVNTRDAIATCGDKILTNLALLEYGIPTPRAAMAFSRESALVGAHDIGYPVVVKPPIGSWGRLMAKVNDRQTAESIVEHKEAMDNSGGSPFYVQDYIHKPGYDIRTLVVGDETLYAVRRSSAHWITNTARGGQVSNLAVTDELDRLSLAAAAAVGGEIVAVDILEDADGVLTVNEVNHTPEFHGAMQVTDVDIAGKMVDYVLRLADG